MALIVISCASISPTIAPTPSPTLRPSPAPTAAPPSFEAITTDTVNGVTVTELIFDGGRPSDAYLVVPQGAAAGSAAGVLWFHWLESGAPNSNKTEFLEEAKELAAADGVVSLLVNGSFPWLERPESIEHDKAAIEAEVKMLSAAYELLLTRPEVNPERTALAGHDFGAMYSSILFSRDQRPRAMVMMAPTARWADWYLAYWSIPDDHDEYRATMAPLDPVTTLARSGGRPVLLQFANGDLFIPAEVADEITAAAGATAERLNYEASHELNEEATDDRDVWLVDHL
jgi:predicted esterase